MREKKIILTSIVGIVANVLLVAFKLTVGFLASAVSIISDGINNLTDALSSLITIIGVKLSNKKPDKKHPYGHGRIEYITSLAIAALVIFAGSTAIFESINGLISGEVVVSYTPFTLIVVGVAVLVKIALGIFFKKQGKKLGSDALSASGVDAISDSILTLSTLVVGLICFFAPEVTNYHLENWLSIIIGCFIVKAGIEIMLESISNIIGKRADQDLINNIKEMVNSFPEVQGAYDLILNNYGPSKLIGSIHIQIDDDVTAKEIHHLTKKIQEQAMLKFGVILTVGIYANNETSEEIKKLKNDVINLVKSNGNVIQMHGFYVDSERNIVTFDIIFDDKCEDHKAELQKIHGAISTMHPEYNFFIIEDFNISD